MYRNKEYDILEIIHENPESVRQRDLAAAADLYLGMTNAVLKKLVTKGLLVMKRVNSRNIQYALTPEGIAEMARRSKSLLKYTLQNVVDYRRAVEQFIKHVQEEGYDSVILEGTCDIDFIVEWACIMQGITYNFAGTNSWTSTEDELLKVIEEVEKCGV